MNNKLNVREQELQLNLKAQKEKYQSINEQLRKQEDTIKLKGEENEKLKRKILELQPKVSELTKQIEYESARIQDSKAKYDRTYNQLIQKESELRKAKQQL